MVVAAADVDRAAAPNAGTNSGSSESESWKNMQPQGTASGLDEAAPEFLH